MTGLGMFDLVVMVVVLISVGTSAMRGLIRESFSIITLMCGVMCGYLSLVVLGEPARAFLPEGWPEFVLSGLVVGSGFLGAYAVSAWIGERLSHLARSIGDLGALDSLAGAGFGLTRAAVLIVAANIAVEKIVPQIVIPEEIGTSHVYPWIAMGSDWIQSVLPGLYDRVRDVTGDRV